MRRKASRISMIILNKKKVVGRKYGKQKERPMERPVVERSKTSKIRK